jgi:hypothetical protein
MKANEYRIGNIVYKECFDNDRYPYKIEHKITGHDIECLDVDGVFYQEGQAIPIPLTEDWLLKCGSERDRFNDVFIYLDKENDLRLYLTNGFIQLCKDHCAPLFNYEYVIYVHRFQNLYLSLKGEELTIK